PAETLTHWQTVHGVTGLSEQELAPYFEERERRLNVIKWEVPPNANNDKLKQGCEKLNIPWHSIPRNVNGCWNLGYCGLGCPTNAKQSMLVTTIPQALKNNAQLIYQARAWKLINEGGAIKGVVCQAMNDDRVTTTGVTIEIRAQNTIMACGGISGPGLMLRSKLPDPYKRIGKRTFLHPVPFSMAIFPEKVDGYWGAPQSVYSDHFVWKDGATGPMGFKLEVSPLQPGLVGGLIGGFGTELREAMSQLPYIHSMIALLRDGFHPESEGGNVILRDDETPVVESYPFNDYLRDGIRRALLTLAELQFAAGAQKVRPSNNQAPFYTSWVQAKEAIPRLPLERITQRLGCAHVMGGCAMGEDPKTSVVNSEGKFHHLDNLYVFDGSMFPTSIGANPQFSIYGIVAKHTQGLLKKLGKAVA
ncbi:MAG TPA: GMC family oxidoreductase N-terminal domain-containing protein, partial [Pseudomonadales bacterium]|nr:GMC family oxidoreductase N-terminal domain-containing protein [Pseudomonadales bacterium]